MALNMDGWVTPNHFNVADFEKFGSLTARQEFDLIAPIAVYHMADLKYKSQARAALQQLKKLGHPLVADKSVSEILEDNSAPDGLGNRYNALMMAIVEEVAPGTESYIDEYGSFGFRIGDDDSVLMGDASGIFAYYMNANAVVERVESALEDA